MTKQRIANFLKLCPLTLVFLIIIFGLILRSAIIINKHSFSHDESISYLAATANQGNYQKVQEDGAYPYGVWVPASEWKIFFIPKDPFAFHQIGNDLAEFDIHPPLYFWLLHIWTLIFKVHPWTGPTLNLVIFSFGVLSLFGLAKFLLQDTFDALFVCCIWAVSPALLDITVEARQYELLGVCTIFFIWVVLRYIKADTHSWKKWFLIVVSVSIGALTHYHFVLVVMGAVLIFTLKLIREKREFFYYIFSGISVGYLISFALHPKFLLSIKQLAMRQGQETQYYWTLLDFLRRVYATGYTYTRFWVYGAVLQVLLFCLFLSFAIWVCWKFLRNRAAFTNRLKQENVPGIEAVYFFLWISSITIILYLLLLSPGNAMTTRHMSLVWPFFAFLPITLLHFVKRRKRLFQWLMLSIVIYSGISTVYFNFVSQSNNELAVEALNRSNYIVVDTVHRGVFPRIFWQVTDETMIFAANQFYLINHFEEWQQPDFGGNISYVNSLSYDNTLAAKEEIVALLATKNIELSEISEYVGTTVYQLNMTSQK